MQQEIADALDDLIMSKGVVLDDGRLDWLTDFIAARVARIAQPEGEHHAHH
jgi:hypothetical protein